MSPPLPKFSPLNAAPLSLSLFSLLGLACNAQGKKKRSTKPPAGSELHPRPHAFPNKRERPRLPKGPTDAPESQPSRDPSAASMQSHNCAPCQTPRGYTPGQALLPRSSSPLLPSYTRRQLSMSPEASSLAPGPSLRRLPPIPIGANPRTAPPFGNQTDHGSATPPRTFVPSFHPPKVRGPLG